MRKLVRAVLPLGKGIVCDVRGADFNKAHRAPGVGRLRFDVDAVDKDAHPLIACAVRINRITALSFPIPNWRRWLDAADVGMAAGSVSPLTAKTNGPGKPGPLDCLAKTSVHYAANSAFIFFSAFASTWRMRSAETPYSSASSCRVTLLSSSSQRRWMMSRERGSSCSRPSRRNSSW